jgi:hypothetical protein
MRRCIRRLFELWPEGIREKNKNLRTPLHLADDVWAGPKNLAGLLPFGQSCGSLCLALGTFLANPNLTKSRRTRPGDRISLAAGLPSPQYVAYSPPPQAPRHPSAGFLALQSNYRSVVQSKYIPESCVR